MEDYEKELLDYIDNGELNISHIKEIVFENGIQTKYGEPRRWSRSASTISQIGDRFFLTEWECGLTEYQDNEFYDNPIEVFYKENTFLVPEHYETTKYWQSADKLMSVYKEE